MKSLEVMNSHLRDASKFRLKVPETEEKVPEQNDNEKVEEIV